MDPESASSLRRRAAVHAALSDPARLMIVDALTLGDQSPSRLQRRLGMSSNLLAHHVKVLQDQGLVVRSRSEADRRRTYVRLVPSALAGMVPGLVTDVTRIVFVCTANSARSQLAAALWQRASAVPAASAGTHPADRVHPGAVEVARRNGMPLPAGRPRLLEAVVSDDDVLITVCDNAQEELNDRAALHWSVPDPVRVGTDAAFESALDHLTVRVTDLASRVRPLDRSSA